jgi:Ca2+-binding RTX toxin-like protein
MLVLSRGLCPAVNCFDLATFSEVPATIVGTNSSKVLRGTSGRDVIAGLDGNDFATGQMAEDIVSGGDGNDELIGNLGNDVLLAGRGDDALLGDQPVPGGSAEPSSFDICNGQQGTDLAVPDTCKLEIRIEGDFVPPTGG